MANRTLVRPNEYHDSVQLMMVSERLRKMAGVRQAMVAMATDNNKNILRDIGLLDAEGERAGADDMIVAVDADDAAQIEQAVAEMEAMFVERTKKRGGRVALRSFEAAHKAMPDANLCVISVPGTHAAAEARKALEAGLHVLIFSNNVPLEDDRDLKVLARAKGLLCMGPDCGVGNLNGIAMLTGSVVRKGPIGIVGASGSGTQQITVLADRAGIGISQAIGVGGKDLDDNVGGLGMLSGIEALVEDPETSVIVLVSRAPGKRTEGRILDAVRTCPKPVVVYFIGGDTKAVEAAGGIPAHDLDDAAAKAIGLAAPEQAAAAVSVPEAEVDAIVERESARMAAGQKYLRGLFCGGTFCEEAMAVLHAPIGDIYSNAPLRPDLVLEESCRSQAHTIVDYGDEEFTLGRPHPVIDPEPRRLGILREAADAEVAVLLLDFILSPAVHPDPAGAVAETLRQAKAATEKAGRYLSVVASVCGTEGDPQRLSDQERTLRDVGVVVMPSNAQAARIAGRIVEAAAGRHNRG